MQKKKKKKKKYIYIYIYINEAFTYIMHKYFPIFFFMFPGYKYAVHHNASFYFSDICGACLPGLSFYVPHM